MQHTITHTWNIKLHIHTTHYYTYMQHKTTYTYKTQVHITCNIKLHIYETQNSQACRDKDFLVVRPITRLSCCRVLVIVMEKWYGVLITLYLGNVSGKKARIPEHSNERLYVVMHLIIILKNSHRFTMQTVSSPPPPSLG